MPRSLRALVPALLAALAAVLVAVLGVGVAAPATAVGTDPAGTDPAGTDPVRAAQAPVPGPVVLVGVTGLRWDDVGSLTTPALWELSRGGSVGTVAARSVGSRACPADGWLAVSAGARAADLPAEDRTCRTLRDPGEAGTVPGWDDYLAAAAGESYGARPGTLGRVLAAAGTPAVGIGPGAAIALADPDGVPVGEHLRGPSTPAALRALVRESAAGGAALLVVDAGQIRDPGYATAPRLPSSGPTATAGPAPVEEEAPLGGAPTVPDLPGSESIVEPSRAQQAVSVDERVAAVLEGLGNRDATVLVVSLADSGRVVLQLAAATGPGLDGTVYDENLLASGSTRQAGVVQSTDVTPTVLALLGLADDAPALPGARIRPVPGPDTGAARVGALLDAQQEASAVTRVSGTFSARLVLSQAALFVAAAVVLTRRARTGGGGPLRPSLRVLQVVALALGAAPVASFLVGLLPWWRADRPVTAFWWALVGWVAVITALALAGPWRRHVLGPAGVVAGTTVGVLVVDALTGSNLVIDAPMGAHRILAARFYGLSNQAFALITAAGVLVAVVVADALLRRGRRGRRCSRWCSWVWCSRWSTARRCGARTSGARPRSSWRSRCWRSRWRGGACPGGSCWSSPPPAPQRRSAWPTWTGCGPSPTRRTSAGSSRPCSRAACGTSCGASSRSTCACSPPGATSCWRSGVSRSRGSCSPDPAPGAARSSARAPRSRACSARCPCCGRRSPPPAWP
ncbi:hypothetical protein GC089_01435 [Cellulomonas sp. JZ18]|uniref:hypothetical protein n=1 Tax=Cellulomonas sp. JZ18 TaxID=2654191 RepID=UPI0012D3F5C6|nr:hypothetical protein [Cellulomonas sp. JZ18]QGQ18173.1 hypothetical protein GC089_01435 [Cellulomonas sp. JZ18]